MRRAKRMLFAVLMVAVLLLLTGCSVLSNAADTNGQVVVGQQDSLFGGLLGNRDESLDIVMLLTVLTLLPSILILFTAFTRIIIVLSFVRSGIGMQQTPPNQVLIGLALFLTFFVMSPVFTKIYDDAYKPYIANQITEQVAEERAMAPLREFMLHQTYQKDLDFYISAAKTDAVIKAPEDIPNSVLIPAYVTSEIKRGFEIGFFIYIPFIVIDMIVASTLMSMGMMMLPPSVISLPFKVLLFVLVDGWGLTIQTLIHSFG